MRITDDGLRTLIRETLAGQGMPWGGVREGEEWIPGQKTRAGTLGRLANIGEQMSELNVELRQLYIDALDALEVGGRLDEYDKLMARIAEVREQLNELEVLYAITRTELDKR